MRVGGVQHTGRVGGRAGRRGGQVQTASSADKQEGGQVRTRAGR